MSTKAGQRLRDTLLTRTAPGYLMWDVTLTIPGTVTPEEWDKLRRRYFKRLERAGCAALWRVELQKRKQPHLHMIIWTPTPPAEIDGVTRKWTKRENRKYLKLAMLVMTPRGWLDCLPEVNRNHPGANSHAYVFKGPFREIEQSVRWMAYLAAHTSKHKKEQLGWQGKQWGMINADLLQERTPVHVAELTDDSEKMIKRTISRWHNAKLREARAKLRAKGKRCKRPRRLHFNRGCKASRLMCPRAVQQVVKWATDRPVAALERQCLPPAGGREASDQAGAGGTLSALDPHKTAPPSPTDPAPTEENPRDSFNSILTPSA